jgi:NADPH-dependent 2,4-dienoyl-CoA reductase/sulfur reductase-like enzyme/nitrite reductase/ring-hydroxylating ferredoxin subunit
MGDNSPPTGPDFTKGVSSTELPAGGVLLGQADGEAVLLVRRPGAVYAIGAKCTHYSSSLVDGLVEGDTIRCPWHHACFDLKSGEAIGAPALNPLPCWDVKEKDGRIQLFSKLPHVAPGPRVGAKVPESVVIIGAGAAGESAAEEVRRRGYVGPVTMIDADSLTPVDRPNLSKDNLAGTAPEEWAFLKPDDFWAEKKIERRQARVTGIDVKAKKLELEGGGSLSYGALLIATGATPIQPDLPGDGPAVFTLRSLADMRAIIKAAEGKKRAVVLGASFIGLEVAGSLRARGLEVHVAAPDSAPLIKVLGPQLSAVVKKLHEDKGVHFHLERKAVGRAPNGVKLSDGSVLEGDFIVAGVGVRPSIALAEKAGLALDRGVTVDQFLATSAPGVWAAGDIARYPDAWSGEKIRVEHWSAAQEQGRIAARNMIGIATPFRETAFFWSQHYDVTIGYVGHAEKWDQLVVEGNPEKLDCAVRFMLGGKQMAVVTIGRDRASLEAHAAMNRGS